MTTTTSKRQAPARSVPLTIWPVGQIPAHEQRSGYLAACAERPGPMLPALARRIIEEYSKPGDLVVDPMCGIGTTLVEAAALGRRAIGIETQRQWAGLATKNLRHVLPEDQRHLVRVQTGNARALPQLLADAAGGVHLVCTSPLGAGQSRNRDNRPRAKDSGPRATALGDSSPLPPSPDDARDEVSAGAMADLYAACFEVLRPGGLLVAVTQNSRRHHAMVDRAGSTVSIARTLGFTYLQHVVALHATISTNSLVARSSPGQRTAIRKARDRGEPAHLVVHDDVSVLRKPSEPTRGY
jgi:DNA modification methylase